MRIGFLFPGQGAQTVGMGKDIFENYKEAQVIYEKVKQITGIDVSKISFYGPEEKLNETKYTQIAILTMSLAILEILKKENIKAQISAGLSLGEYSALIYSNALTFEEGVRLVQKRGEYMQDLTPNGEWLMAAIIGMTDKQVEEICQKATLGFVVPANYNCKGQVVISGEKNAVEEIADLAKEKGAKKVRILKTSGPFHTKKLSKAAEALKKELENVHIQKLNTLVIKNIDGELYNDADDIKQILTEHIISPVKFSKTIETMLENQVDTFIEIGPGKTLSGFVKKADTDKEINILNINNIETLQNVINFIKKEE